MRLVRLTLIIILTMLFLDGSRAYSQDIGELEALVLRESFTNCVYKGREMLKHNMALSKERRIKYLMGISYLKLGNSNMAREYFRDVITDKADELTILSIVGVGDSYYFEKEYTEAIKRYSYLLSKFRRLDLESNVALKLAQSYYKMGHWQEARKYFRQAAEEKGSFDAELAKRILEEDVFYFTVQVGSFTSEDNARDLYRELRQDDFSAYIKQDEINQCLFYRVRVGKYQHKQQAYKEEARLKRLGLPTKIYP